jgi:hypothetical protein
MSSNYIRVILALISLSFSLSAMAESMSKSKYEAAEKNIEADYLSAKKKCDALANNTKNFYGLEAKGNEHVAKAEPNTRQKFSRNASYEVSVAKVKADYKVASEKCEGSTGNIKDVCLKAAKYALVSAKADTMTSFKKSKVNKSEDYYNAHTQAKEQSREVRYEAAIDKYDANYAVEK